MNDALLTILAQVAEQMGFLTPTGPGTGPGADGPVVRVAFRGPVHGEVVIAASTGLAEALARNLLAADPDAPVAADDALDAVRELANIVAGNALPALLGDAEYHLDPPMAGSWPRTGEVASLECIEGVLSVCCAAG